MNHFALRFVLLQLALLSTLAGARAGPLIVTIPPLHPSSREHAAYFPKLLALALEKTRVTDGAFEIRSYAQELTSPRQATELKNNGVINVMWDGNNRQRETELLPIRISLLRELNDYRIFLIRKQDEAKFGAITSIDQLRKLKAGSGVNWPSTDILRLNGFNVETTIAYEFLFPMLKVGRFDYMPRGIYEIWFEQRMHAADGLVIEQSIALHYPVPFYFYVSRTNPALASRIERGLRIALHDGSFERLFHSVPSFQRSLDELRTMKRRVFELQL